MVNHKLLCDYLSIKLGACVFYTPYEQPKIFEPNHAAGCIHANGTNYVARNWQMRQLTTYELARVFIQKYKAQNKYKEGM